MCVCVSVLLCSIVWVLLWAKLPEINMTINIYQKLTTLPALYWHMAKLNKFLQQVCDSTHIDTCKPVLLGKQLAFKWLGVLFYKSRAPNVLCRHRKDEHLNKYKARIPMDHSQTVHNQLLKLSCHFVTSNLLAVFT